MECLEVFHCKMLYPVGFYGSISKLRYQYTELLQQHPSKNDLVSNTLYSKGLEILRRKRTGTPLGSQPSTNSLA